MATEKSTAKSTKPKEDSRVKFVRLVNGRANRVAAAIDTLQKLSSGGYEYTPEDVAAVFGPLRAMLDTAEGKFRQPTKRGKREPITFV